MKFLLALVLPLAVLAAPPPQVDIPPQSNVAQALQASLGNALGTNSRAPVVLEGVLLPQGGGRRNLPLVAVSALDDASSRNGMQVLTSSGEESDYTVVLQVDTTTGETTGFLQSNGIVYNVIQGPGNSPLRVVEADSFTPPPRNMNMPDALPVPMDRNLRGNNNNDNNHGLHPSETVQQNRRQLNQDGYSYEVEVFFEIDQQFINNSPGSANDLAEGLAYLDVLLSGLNLVYEKEIDTHISIKGVEVTTRYNAASDTSQALDLLKQARDYGDWPQGADLVHAVLGRGLGGGIAYLGTICNTGFGFGVSAGLAGQYQGGCEYQGRVVVVGLQFPDVICFSLLSRLTLSPTLDSVVWDIVVLAHELGHNFGKCVAHTSISCIWKVERAHLSHSTFTSTDRF